MSAEDHAIRSEGGIRGAIIEHAHDERITVCIGTTNVPCVQGGQYALINVVTGNTYTFSTCGASFDTQITLYNNAGGGSLGYNDDFCGLQSTCLLYTSDAADE